MIDSRTGNEVVSQADRAVETMTVEERVVLLEQKVKGILDCLERAASVVRSMIPNATPLQPDYETAASYRSTFLANQKGDHKATGAT